MNFDFEEREYRSPAGRWYDFYDFKTTSELLPADIRALVLTLDEAKFVARDGAIDQEQLRREIELGRVNSFEFEGQTYVFISGILRLHLKYQEMRTAHYRRRPGVLGADLFNFEARLFMLGKPAFQSLDGADGERLVAQALRLHEEWEAESAVEMAEKILAKAKSEVQAAERAVREAKASLERTRRESEYGGA